MVLPLLVATSFILVSGRNAEYIPRIILTEVTNAVLGCELTFSFEECMWKGPHSQEIASGSDEVNEKYEIRRMNEGHACNLTITRAEIVDEGIWNCHSENGSHAAAWRLIIADPPKPPVILLHNGTSYQPVAKTINVYDEDSEPVVLDLECVSRRAKPAQDSISLLINGHPARSACYYTNLEPLGYYVSWITATIVIHNKEALETYSVANVTCVVDHVTGQSTTTRSFGLYDYSRRVEMTQEDVANRPGAKRLKCKSVGYPWYIRYYITKERPLPSTEYLSQEVIVTESGEYSCTGVSEGERQRSRTRYYTVTINGISSGVRLTASIWFLIASTVTSIVIMTRGQEGKM